MTTFYNLVGNYWGFSLYCTWWDYLWCGMKILVDGEMSCKDLLKDIRSVSLDRDQCQIWTAPSESHVGQKMNHGSHKSQNPMRIKKKENINCTTQILIKVTALGQYGHVPHISETKAITQRLCLSINVSQSEMEKKHSRRNINHYLPRRRQILEMTGS